MPADTDAAVRQKDVPLSRLGVTRPWGEPWVLTGEAAGAGAVRSLGQRHGPCSGQEVDGNAAYPLKQEAFLPSVQPEVKVEVGGNGPVPSAVPSLRFTCS